MAGWNAPSETNESEAAGANSRWASHLLYGALWFVPLIAAIFRRYALEHDSVNFALAATVFDVRLHQPHPAGFPWWVALIRLFDAFGLNPLMSQTLLAFLFTVAAALLWWRWEGGVHEGGVYLLLLSPIAWYYAAVPATYAVDLAFGCLLLVVATQAWDGDRRAALWLAVGLGVWSGFRSSSAIFMTPLMLACAWRARTFLRSAAIFAALWLVWFVPVAWMTGGLGAFLREMREMTSPFFARTSIFYGATAEDHLAALRVVANFLFLMLAPAALGVLFSAKRKPPRRIVRRTEWLFVSLFAAPAFLFVTLVHGPKPGYCLILLPPLLALMVSRVRLSGPSLAVAVFFSIFLSFAPYERVLPIGGAFQFNRATLRSVFEIEDAYRAIAALPKTDRISIRTDRSEGPNFRTLEYHFPSVRWTTNEDADWVVTNPGAAVKDAQFVSGNTVYSLWKRDSLPVERSP